MKLAKSELLALENIQAKINTALADHAEVVKDINDRLKIDLKDFDIVAGGYLKEKPKPPEKPQNDIPAKTPRQDGNKKPKKA